MIYLLKACFVSNKKINIFLVFIFLVISIFKFEAGLIAALYIIIKISKAISDYNYFNNLQKIMQSFPKTQNYYIKYCIVNNNIINIIILSLWIIIGVIKKSYPLGELIYYASIIYLITTIFKYLYDISDIGNRALYIENLRKSLFMGIAVVFILISRIPGLYNIISYVIFRYNTTKMIILISLLFLINLIFYITSSKLYLRMK